MSSDDSRVLTRDVLFVLFDGVQSLDLTGPLEVFANARWYVDGEQAYRPRTASVGGEPVRTSGGLRITPDFDLAAAPVPHTLVVPGGFGSRQPQPALVDWLRRVGPSTPAVSSGSATLPAAVRWRSNESPCGTTPICRRAARSRSWSAAASPASTGRRG